MKKISVFIVVILSFNVAQSQSEASLFKLGVHIDSVAACNTCKSISVIFDRGGIKPGLSCSIRGILFQFIYSDDGRIIQFYTSDSGFLIRNYRYLTRDKHIIDSIKKEKIIFTDLFDGAYLNLPDGWRLGFLGKDIIIEKGRKYLKENALPFYLYKTSLLTEFPPEEEKRFRTRKYLDPIKH